MSTFWWAFIIVAYAALMIGIGIYTKKNAEKDYASFGLARGKFGVIAITLVTVGAWIGGGGLIGLSTYCYEGGLAEYWTYAMAYLGGIPWILLFAKRVHAMGLYTAADLLCLRFPDYRQAIRYPSAFLYLLRNATLLAMQLNALAFLFESFFGWGHGYGVCIGAVIIIIYTAISGFMSVVLTGMIQSVLQTIAPILALILVLSAVGGWEQVNQHYLELGVPEYSSLFGGMDAGSFAKFFFTELFTVGLFYMVGDQFDYQRIGAAKNAKTAQKSMMLGIFIAVPFLVLPGLIGMAAALYLPEGFNAATLFYEVTKTVPAWAGIILLLGALSTIMSATSAYLFGAAMNASHDIILNIFSNAGKTVSDSTKIWLSRLGVLIAGIIGVVFAIMVPGIVQVWLTGLYLCTGGLFMPFMACWFSKKMNTQGAMAGMIVGTATSFVWMIAENPLGLHCIHAGIIASLIAMILVRAVTKAPDPADVEKTYYFSEKYRKAKKQGVED